MVNNFGDFFYGSVVETRSNLAALKLEMKRVKKTELHLHLGGAWTIEHLRKIASPQDFDQLCQFLSQISSGIDYHEGFKVFGLLSKIVNTDFKVEEGVIALCKNLEEDNVHHAEIRTGLKDLGSGLEGYLLAVLRGLEQGRRFNVKVGLILSLRRDTPAEIAEMTVDLAIKHRKSGIVGFDLSGDSTQGDGTAAIAALKRAKSEGFPISLHIGESTKETGEQQIYELRELTPQRVGHCVHLGSEARQWILDNQTPVEMCLTSALKVQMVESMDQHPALKMMKEGHPVIICSDDTTIFQVSLSDELAHAAEVGIPMSQILELQESALKYSFLSCF